MENVVFTNLSIPEVRQLFRQELETYFQANKQAEQPTALPDQLLTIQQAAELLHLSVPTLYSKVSKRELPCMKQGKRLYFSQKELVEYLKQGRKKTTGEIEAEAEAYLSNKKRLSNGK